MLEVDTFFTALYVMVDDFHKSRPTERRHPGPDASLCESEIVTLAIFSPASPDSPVNGTSTATLGLTCATPSQPCLLVRSSTARCVRTWSSSRK